MIHRDVKPSDVLVTEHDGTPVPKVIDVGVAKAIHQPLTGKTIYTRHQHIVGTEDNIRQLQMKRGTVG